MIIWTAREINHIGSLSAAINQPKIMMPAVTRHRGRRDGIRAEKLGWFKSQLSQLTRDTLAMSLTSLSLDFICKMGMPISRSGYEDYKR